MAWRRKTEGRDQWVETFIYRAGQFVRRNRVASAAAGLLLISLLGGVIATWVAYRAKEARARAEHLSNDVRQLVHLRRVNYYDALDDLAGTTRMRGPRKDALTSNVRHDLADVRNDVGSTIEGYRPTALENLRTEPAMYQELVPRDQTYIRTFPMTYPNPGGVSFLTGVDLAALNLNDGDFLVRINKPQAALQAFQNKLASDEQLVAADPANVQVQTDLAYNSSRIGDLLANTGDHLGALPYYQRAVDIYTRNAATGTQDPAVSLKLSRLLAKLAQTHATLGYIEKALAECNKAADLLEAVTVDTANVEQRRLRASAYSELGDAYSLLARDSRTPQKFMKGLWRAARDSYEHSLEILNGLRDRGVLNADELTEIDTISHKIAESDVFLAK